MSIASTLFPFSLTPQRRTTHRGRFNGALLLSPLLHIGALKFTFSRKSYWYKRRCSGLDQNLAVRPLCSQVKLEGNVDDEACELVNGVDLVIGEAQDSIHAYLLKAVKNNNGTGILLLSDIFGFEDSSTRDFAYRVACNGYKL